MMSFAQLMAACGIGSARLSLHLKERSHALLGPDRKPCPDAAIPVVKQFLGRSLMQAGNPDAWLLRGSSAPDAGQDVLLRPAQRGAETPADELLRPER